MDLPQFSPGAKYRTGIYTLIASALVLIFILDILAPSEFTVWILYFIPLLLTLYTWWRNGPFIIAFLIILLNYVTYFISPINPASFIDMIDRFFFSILVVILAYMIGNYKQNVEDLQKSEEEARLANKKLRLLSGITRHDIKNQLLALGSYISLSSGAIENPEKLRDYFAREEKITGTIGQQISFTADYENLGMQSPAWQEICSLARNAASALPMGSIRLSIECPPTEIYADPLLEKVFYNLIDNSLHYGGESLTGLRITTEEPNKSLMIRYEDNGMGISAGDKTKLFRRGFGKHTGLGLFLSREILSITGITIEETGEYGKGVRFEIRVPEGSYRVPSPNPGRIERH